MVVELNGGEGAKLACPRCNSENVWKDDKRETRLGNKQRYRCKDCGRRFTGEIILSGPNYGFNICQVCDDEGSKNLTVAINGYGATGEITEQEKLLTEYLFYLKRLGRKEDTIIRKIRYLKRLVEDKVNLLDPDEVALAIYDLDWVPKSKNGLCATYTQLLEMLGKEWKKPYYSETEKLPFIPKESELDALIVASGWKNSVYLQILKETGARACEASSLKWDQVDFETSTIRIEPEKGSNPRVFKVSEKLISMLSELKRRNGKSKRIFALSIRSIRQNFRNMRRRLAFKEQNDRLLRITFHTFRHWFATMLYHKTKDIVLVQRKLGHKSIKNTLMYVQLAEELFKGEIEYVCRTAETPKQAIEFAEQGFEKFDEFDGLHLYRKIK